MAIMHSFSKRPLIIVFYFDLKVNPICFIRRKDSDNDNHSILQFNLISIICDYHQLTH